MMQAGNNIKRWLMGFGPGLCYAAVLLLDVCFSSGGFRWNYPALVAGVVGILVGSLPLYFYNRKVVSFFDETDATLTSMIAGDAAACLPQSLQTEAESVMSRFDEKLRRLYDLQEDMQAKAKKENQALQMLVSDISHQVKTPLANIKLNLGILEKSMKGEGEQFITAAQGAADKLDFLLTALVKMSRLETGVIQLAPQRENVYDMLANVLGAVMPTADQKALAVAVDCPHTLTALMDKKWTEEALLNIVDNAVKYTPPHGRLTISAQGWECYTRITVLDSGPGISEEEQAHIFSRFYRCPDVYDKPGIGIGLTLAREIITKQRGYIKLESQRDAGAAFHVFLPV